MKNIKTMFLGVTIFSILFTALPFCYGLDTDLYVLSGVNVPPNVLIILDSSASMDEVDQDSGEPYDPTKNYAADNQ